MLRTPRNDRVSEWLAIAAKGQLPVRKPFLTNPIDEQSSLPLFVSRATIEACAT
jgi:hypothetical protein